MNAAKKPYMNIMRSPTKFISEIFLVQGEFLKLSLQNHIQIKILCGQSIASRENNGIQSGWH